MYSVPYHHVASYCDLLCQRCDHRHVIGLWIPDLVVDPYSLCGATAVGWQDCSVAAAVALATVARVQFLSPRTNFATPQ